MTAPQQSAGERAFATFLQLENQARAAASSEALAYSIVNDGLGLFEFRHVALLIGGRVRAVTGVSVPDPHAPFIAFIERAALQLQQGDHHAAAGVVSAEWLDAASRDDWQALSAAEALWLPLKGRDGGVFGGVWLARDRPWQPAECLLGEQLAGAWSHAWLALEPRKIWQPQRLRRKAIVAVVLAALALLFPVRQTVLAPAEVVPLGGRVVTAPLDGVIAEFMVKPNQPVKKDQLLVRFDNTVQKAQADVAARALGVAEAELHTGSQRAFQDAESKSRLDLLAATVAQKRAELAYAQDLLQRSEVRAERDGIAVFADADRMTGKPLRTGERLMELADPAQSELKIELDVGDAIEFPAQAAVALFPDSDPLTRYDARLERVAYEAAQTPGGGLAYRLDARFTDRAPRIGLRGTARVSGEKVALGVYLFRRPLAALRKTLGV
ncbi:efflux RND transporter periplasmic adaptor subunit [Erwinia sp. Leaf53]|uniref:efflux RND transporter periplasmic adaptor subunit n=2 Tax=unclassified Erwinia TaxID=2622719 RepID=UPI0006F955C3|nr:HlyD family efflux transporter periplasmic adaptor subunit [Erwinia sp. Leaf53]KQN61761.1 multidrug transporter [Erwinia sp. Leaf53]